MRRFRDARGRGWELWVGRESWGIMVALLVPLDGGETRRASLASTAPDDAEREVDAMGEEELLTLLSRSVPVDP
jgi:hypothetical protein